MDLLSGEEIDIESFHNSQKKFGADVIFRINYTQKADGFLSEVQEAIIDGLNMAVSKLVERNSFKKENIYQLTAVGNTIMLHFLLGVNPESIARVPYRPVFTKLIEMKANELGLDINPHAVVQILPAISGYVGSDIIGDLLVTDFDSEDCNLLIV